MQSGQSNKWSKQISNISSIQIKNIDILIQKRFELTRNIRPLGLADTIIYHYTKQGGLFSKKQQRIVFQFFQGLNTNPQNLSIYLRDLVTRNNNYNAKNNIKQKITKGQFIIYDIFNDNDCVIQINIPGNFQIYKIKNSKKQLISNSEIDTMYVSSIMRSMYQRNMVWGKCYNLFGSRNVLQQFKSFLHVFFRVLQKYDLHISDDFQYKCLIKGSHACQILFEYVKSKCIVRHTIQFIQKQIVQKNKDKDKDKGGYSEVLPKILILLAQLYSFDGKYAKSLRIICVMLNKYPNQPYLLYYQAKYMFQLIAVHQALLIVNNIIQYNQFQIWCLAAQLHIELKNYSQALVCLNHASRIAYKSSKQGLRASDIQLIYAQFQKIGKKNLLGPEQQLSQRPKLMAISQTPISIFYNVQQKYHSILQNQYWRMSYGQKNIYNLLKIIKYRLDTKKFQQLIQSTFLHQTKKTNSQVSLPFKNIMNPLTDIEKRQQVQIQSKNKQKLQKQRQQELPNFLKDQEPQLQIQQAGKGNRNLSIIPELQSVIENSQFQQKQKQSHNLKPVKHKKERTQQFNRILKALQSQGQIQKMQFEQNWGKILPIYNKLRTSAKLNSFYLHKLFQSMIKLQNYKSVIVLIAESLDMYETMMGPNKIKALPFWMQKYIFRIIEDKGLKTLNTLLQKLEFMDEAVIDTIQLAKYWKIKGCTY